MDRTRPGRWWWAIAALAAAAAAAEFAMGRAPICRCGHVALWAGSIRSPENSQQVFDWYSFSHIVHGFLLYAVTRLSFRRMPVGPRLTIAAAIEAGWEVVENAPVIIGRYRTATIAVGYLGDSILNSMSDIGCMMLGFAVTRRMPVWATVAIAIAFELLMLAVIRDNLTLNLLMLIAPSDAIRQWQGGG